MTQRAVPSRHPEMALGSRHSQWSAIMVLSLVCCATALAATSPMTACDRTADLQSLDVPVSDLSATVAGHVIVEPDDQDDAAIDVLAVQGRSEALILDLAPRVAVILQDVFSAVAIETPSLDSSDQTQAFAIESSPKEESPLSPLAGDAAQADPSELTDFASGIEDVDTAPSIHRQMFRTDI